MCCLQWAAILNWDILSMNKTTTYIIKPEQLEKLRTQLIGQQKSAGLVVCFSTPAVKVIEILKKNKINSSKLVFINFGGQGTKQIVNVPDMGSLTELSLAISNVLEAMADKKKFLMMSGISILTLHHEKMIVARFLQFLMDKLRTWDVDGFLITDQSIGPESISILTQFADKVVKK